MLVNTTGKYPEPDKDKPSNEALLHGPESHKSALPLAPPPQQVVLYCPLSGQVCHFKWRLTKLCRDHLDIFYTYTEMGNDERPDLLLKLKDSPNPSGFITTPKVGGMGLNLTVATNAVITQKFWVLNEQRKAFAKVVWLRQNRFPHTWLLNTGSSGYDNRVRCQHQLSGVVQMRVLHGLVNRRNIITLMIYGVLAWQEDYMKQVMVHGNLMPSDGEDEWKSFGQCNQGTPL